MIHKLRAWYKLRRHFLLDGEYVVMIEIVKRGYSAALVRSPQFRWHWCARFWAHAVSTVEHDADYLTTRVVSPNRADELEAQYSDWLDSKHAPQEKFSKQLNKWASTKARVKNKLGVE